eukprot:m.300016 g.300016  ORF g.300016 m.300016 type:complete len:61 (+) comp16418_c2_seq3:1543-1725(+)
MYEKTTLILQPSYEELVLLFPRVKEIGYKNISYVTVGVDRVSLTPIFENGVVSGKAIGNN